MWRYFEYEELTSTNDEALALTASAGGEKLAVTATRQTGGRGRRGRSWVSLEGNLFMSLALPFAAEKSAALVLISSLSLLEAVKEFDQNAGVKLKWPNDVLLNGGKISGILLEKGAGGYMIVGIGVNLRASPAGETVYPVTDLAAAGIKTDCRTFKEVYLRRFDALTDLWEQKGMPALTEKWLRHARGLGEPIVVRLPKTTKTGIFAGMNEEGMLILQTPSGREVIGAGDVFLMMKVREKND